MAAQMALGGHSVQRLADHWAPVFAGHWELGSENYLGQGLLAELQALQARSNLDPGCHSVRVFEDHLEWDPEET